MVAFLGSLCGLMGAQQSSKPLHLLFSKDTPGNQNVCSFSPLGTFCAFGGADRRIRSVASRNSVITGRDFESRSAYLPGNVEWLSYTKHGMLLAVIEKADQRELHAWGTIRSAPNQEGKGQDVDRRKSLPAASLDVVISLQHCTPTTLKGPFALSNDARRNSCWLLGSCHKDGDISIRIWKAEVCNDYLQYFPILFTIPKFSAPVDVLDCCLTKRHVISSCAGKLQVWDMLQYRDRSDDLTDMSEWLVNQSPNFDAVDTRATQPLSPGSQLSLAGSPEPKQARSKASPMRESIAAMLPGQSKSSNTTLLGTGDHRIGFSLSPDNRLIATWALDSQTLGLNPQEGVTNTTTQKNDPRTIQLWKFSHSVLELAYEVSASASILCCQFSLTSGWFAVGAGVKYGMRAKRCGYLELYFLDELDVPHLQDVEHYRGAVNDIRFIEARPGARNTWSEHSACLATSSDGDALATGELRIWQLPALEGGGDAEISVLSTLLCGVGTEDNMLLCGTVERE